MTKLINLLALIFVLVFVSCKNSEKSKKSIISPNSNTSEFAKNISEQILIKQKQGSFYEFSTEETTSKMISGLNESLQKTSYAKIKSSFGDFKSLKLDTIVQLKQDKIYQVYRFRGDFESSKSVEVRTVLDSNGKLAGFFVLPWKEGI